MPVQGSDCEGAPIKRDQIPMTWLRHKFRHKAPGIQLQTPIEFTNQPFADRRYNVLFPT
jgi:hypothetical protein